MVIEFPRRFRRIPLDELDAKLAEKESRLEAELEEVRRMREGLRAIRADARHDLERSSPL
jgi:hypothetical protein